MSYILQVDFPYQGPWGDEMATAMEELAKSIAKEPGMIWKIWTENSAQKEAGGIYMFDTEQNARNYLDMHTKRLAGFGITPVTGKIFAVNDQLSRLDNAPL